MLSALTIVDNLTDGVTQQEYNGSCLVLDDSADPQSGSRRKQIIYLTMVIINGTLIAVVTVLGIPGNAVSAAVFYIQGLRERINLCLFALAIVNLIALLPLLLTAVEYLYRYTNSSSFVLFPVTFCLKGAVWASQFLSAVIASERCFCVVSPFHAKRLLKTSTMAAIIVVCCALLTAGMCAIAGPKHRSICLFHPTTRETEDTDYITEYYLKNQQIIDILDVFLYTMGLPGIMVFVNILTTCITAVKLRAALAWRLTTTSKTTTSATASTSTGGETKRNMTSKEVSLTLMLMATSVLITLSMTGNLVVQICIHTAGLDYSGHDFNIQPVIWRVVDFLWVLTFSMNFVVYYRMGSRFRYVVRCILLRRDKNK